MEVPSQGSAAEKRSRPSESSTISEGSNVHAASAGHEAFKSSTGGPRGGDALGTSSERGVVFERGSASVMEGAADLSAAPSPKLLPSDQKDSPGPVAQCSFMLLSVSVFAALTGLLMGYDMCVVAVVLDPVDRSFNLCGGSLTCSDKTLFVSILSPGAIVGLSASKTERVSLGAERRHFALCPLVHTGGKRARRSCG